MGNTSNMLGKLVGPRAIVAGPSFVGAIALLVALASCASNVPQDKASGPDARIKGAKELVLENNEAKAAGIVTYPGGDRVDWRVIQLPDKKKGTLNVKLQWTPPRPGLQLAFDVYNEWNEQLISSSKKAGKKKSRARTRSESLQDAKGKYFIRIYAVERGDAGKYKLTVEFKEGPSAMAFDITNLEIPDPPKLAAVPDYVEPCNDDNFDPKKDECKKYCPESGAPANWAPCKGRCPDPPSVDIEACLATMKCPRPADRRVKSCRLTDFPACPDKRQPDPNNPNCDIPPEPIYGRITKIEDMGSEVRVTIGAGTNRGVATGWKALLITEKDLSSKAVPGGEIKITKVDKDFSIGTTKLNVDRVAANKHVKFVPPSK